MHCRDNGSRVMHVVDGQTNTFSRVGTSDIRKLAVKKLEARR